MKQALTRWHRTFPTYLGSGSHHSDHSTAPNTPSYPATSIGLDYLQVNHSNPDLAHSQSPTTTLAGPQPPVRQHYAFQQSPVSPPVPPVRFINSNPRPAKSPRHIAPPELPSNASYSDYGARFAPPFSGSSEPLPQRDPGYFPTSLPMQAWTTAPDTTGVYGTAMQAPTSNLQHYEFPNENYLKEESHTQQNYTWNPA